MDGEISFLHEKLCFYNSDCKTVNILKAEDLVKVRKSIIDSILKSPAISVLEILSMMSKKGKDLKFLFLLLQDFNLERAAPPMTRRELFNPKNKNHEMNIRKRRVYLLVEKKEQEFMYSYDSSANEFYFRQKLLDLLKTSNALPENIVKIINKTLLSYLQWYTDDKKKGLPSLKHALEKAFIDEKVLVDIDPQETVSIKVFTIFYFII